MNYKSMLNEDDFKRAVKLLNNIKEKCGNKSFLNYRKVVAIAAITDYMQRECHKERWNSFKYFLDESEKWLSVGDYARFSVPNSIYRVGMRFGIPYETISINTLPTLEKMTIKRRYAEFE